MLILFYQQEGFEQKRFQVHTDNSKLLKYESENIRKQLKKWGYKGKREERCSWDDIKNNGVTTGSHNSDCGDCLYSKNCHQGEYGRDWGVLSFSLEKKKHWGEKLKKIQELITENEKIKEKANSRIVDLNPKIKELETDISKFKEPLQVAESDKLKAETLMNSKTKEYELAVMGKSEAERELMMNNSKRTDLENQATEHRFDFDYNAAEVKKLEDAILKQLRFLDPLDIVKVTAPR